MDYSNEQYNIVQDILDKTESEIDKMPPVNILIAGKTGVGKSTLINNVFREKLAETGIGKPVTKHLKRITKEGVPIVLYDTKGLELKESVQKEVKNEIFNLIKEKKENEDPLHTVYYCIQASSSRIEESELNLIKDISNRLPVILVLTQSIGKPAEEFRQYLVDLDLPVVKVQTVMAETYPISDDYKISPFGLKELIHETLHLIPKETREAFTNAQRVDVDRKAKAAKRWASRYVTTTFGVGFIPIPFSDASVLVPMQVTLLAHITAIFGFSIDKATLLSLIAAVGGTGSATMIGKNIVANAFKFIPGAGTMVGGIISGTTASVVTTALAISYIEVLSYLSIKESENESVNLKRIRQLMYTQFKKNIRLNKKKLNKKEIEFDTNQDVQENVEEVSNARPHSKVKKIYYTLVKFCKKILPLKSLK